MSLLELEREVAEFFYREAELLDSNGLEQWLELLTEDVKYEMPVRLTRERGQPETSHWGRASGGRL